MRILFITSSRIGDAVLSTGLLNHLWHTYPRARFTIICGVVAKDVFVHFPRLEHIIAMDKRRFGLHWLDFWRLTVGKRWDLVVDIRGSALAFALWAKKRAIMRPRTGHKIEQLAAILKLDPPPLPVIWISAAEQARAEEIIPKGRPLVALAPTANWDGKVWPAERFARLFRQLADGPLPGARAAVFGGPGEKERALAAPLLQALPDAIDLCGKLSLTETAACLARADLFVGNDSGLMHIAAAVDVPTLGLFGPTPANEYAPVGRRTAVAIARGVQMEDLSLEAAFAAALRLLAQPSLA